MFETELMRQAEKERRIAQLAIENAIDAIMSVIALPEMPNDRYRETMRKLREDEHDYTDE